MQVTHRLEPKDGDRGRHISAHPRPFSFLCARLGNLMPPYRHNLLRLRPKKIPNNGTFSAGSRWGPCPRSTDKRKRLSATPHSTRNTGVLQGPETKEGFHEPSDASQDPPDSHRHPRVSPALRPGGRRPGSG